MRALLILLFITFITNTYCSIHNTMIELLSALIYAAADDNGNIQKELDSLFGVNEDLKINVAADGKPPLKLGIIDIIPELRNDHITFSELYALAEKVYTKHFPIGQDPKDIINEYDIIHYLTTSTKEGNIPISLFNGPLDKKIFYSLDEMQNQKIFYAIKSFKVNNDSNLNKIDINNINIPISIISKETEYLKRTKVIKAIAAQCVNVSKVCKDKYFNDDHDSNNIKFNIITSTNANVTRHTFIIDDIKEEKMAHPFTLAEKKDKNNNTIFVNDDTYSPREITYKDMVKKLNKGYHKKYINSGIEDPGIGLIAKCGIIIDNRDTKYQHMEYVIDDDHLNNWAKGAYIARNKFNEKGYTGYGPNDNIVCRKSDNKFAELETIVLRYIEVQKDADIISTEKLEKINNLIKVLALEKLFPVNMRNRAVGISKGDGHLYELNNTLELSTAIQNAISNDDKVCSITTAKKNFATAKKGNKKYNYL